jgi:hypothetical protein
MAAIYDGLSSKDKEAAVDNDVSDNNTTEGAVDNDVSSNNTTEGAVYIDVSSCSKEASVGDEVPVVLKLYQLMTALCSNPLELIQYSREGQVYI